ncbi:2448_t:CDS:2 [Ambispora leptoticha]|uniref:2448_t:CDS:1 n=1 Tax=Ambispora leptoticha TaxID=144679 RepID=A0A9N8VX13_9GLOM|nr:2448_t:CDS:2 [Ambispora leptoticha]
MSASIISNSKRLPVYYISHGGPTLVIDTHENHHKFLKQLGSKIRKQFKPTAIVVVSAHWQTTDIIRVSSFKDETPLIYDFYGFPDIMYQQKYQNKGSPELASKIVDLLTESKIDAVKDETRGFDHGVWVVLKLLFPEPGDVPIVQVSLKRDASFEFHIKVGKALESLREEGILLIGSGSLVHNLRDFFSDSNSPNMLPKQYATTFDKDVTNIVKNFLGKERENKLIDLKNHRFLKEAHPTTEHLVPLHVIAGAASEEKGEKIFHEIFSGMSSGAFSWGESKNDEVLRDEL